MDIVVKLPDKDYSVMLTKIMLACHGCEIIELPKGHGRLIDANELKKHKYHDSGRYENVVSVAQIDWQPTIIEADEEQEEQHE